jgi:hypothetical protein
MLVCGAEADQGARCSCVSEYLERECRFPDGLQVEEQRRRRSAEVVDVADGLRDRVAAPKKLPLLKVLLDLRALLGLLLLLLLVPLLLVALLPLVLLECLNSIFGAGAVDADADAT